MNLTTVYLVHSDSGSSGDLKLFSQFRRRHLILLKQNGNNTQHPVQFQAGSLLNRYLQSIASWLQKLQHYPHGFCNCKAIVLHIAVIGKNFDVVFFGKP